MQKFNRGISLIEIVFLLLLIVIISLFVVPKVFYKNIDNSELEAKETINIINSAYKTCKFTSPNTCNTVTDLVEYIQYIDNDSNKKFITLPNRVQINYIPNDKVDNGTTFIITLSDKIKTFTLFLTRKGNIFVNKKPRDNEDFPVAIQTINFSSPEKTVK